MEILFTSILKQYGVPTWGQMSQKPSGVFLIQS